MPTPLRRLAILAAAALSVPSAARPASAWIAVATEKIRPSAGARPTASAHVSAARNEFESFQIVVTGEAHGVRATTTSLGGPGTIPTVRLYREALIVLANASAPDGGTGAFPDALVPDVDETYGETRNAFPFDVPAGESRAIWVDVFVPADAAPGEYSGSVHVTWSGGEATVPVALTVWPFTLPSTSTLRTAFGFGYSAIPNGHGLPWGDAFSQLRARYGAFALDHRISLAGIDDGRGPDLGHFSSLYGASIDGAEATLLRGARMTAVQLEGAASTWAPFFRGRGWLDRVFDYTCDEPPVGCAWSQIAPRAVATHAADPGLRTLVTTTLAEAQSHDLASSIDILAPVINFLDDKPESGSPGNRRPDYDAWLAGSARREVWAYQSCMSHGCGGTSAYFTGWPSYMIDASAVRNRAMQWLDFKYRLAGELYFDTALAYSHDPWSNQWDFSGNGDGTLFYPGTPARIGGSSHVPVASLRLKMIREGMEDFEYLALLASLGGEADARAIVDGLFPNAYSTEVPADALMAAREQVAARIIALQGGGAAHPAPVASPDPAPVAPVDPAPAATADPARSAGGCAASGPAGFASLLSLLAIALAARRRR